MDFLAIEKTSFMVFNPKMVTGGGIGKIPRENMIIREDKIITNVKSCSHVKDIIPRRGRRDDLKNGTCLGLVFLKIGQGNLNREFFCRNEITILIVGSGLNESIWRSQLIFGIEHVQKRVIASLRNDGRVNLERHQ
jgi:hypothetical protein